MATKRVARLIVCKRGFSPFVFVGNSLFYQYELTKVAFMKKALLLLSILLCLTAAAFNHSIFQNRDLKQTLESISQAQLKNLDVESDAADEIREIIKVAVDEYNKDKSEDNFDKIKNNFSKYIAKIEENRERVVGAKGGSKYKITNSSVKKAKRSICPMYPWCK